MALEKITVPDLGEADEVVVIELLVSVGQQVQENDSLLVLETDKAAMELPAPFAGVVKSIAVNLGDQMSQGDEILTLEVEAAAPVAQATTVEESSEEEPEAIAESASSVAAEADSQQEDSAAPAGGSEVIEVPDLGSGDEVEVIEIHVAPGDQIAKEDSIVTLESDKAAMELPSPKAGTIEEIHVSIGDMVTNGKPLLTLVVSGAVAPSSKAPEADSAVVETGQDATPAQAEKAQAAAPNSDRDSSSETDGAQLGDSIYAGPAVRKLARELGADLSEIEGTGSRGRIVKEDVSEFVKKRLKEGTGSAAAQVKIPDTDFSQFGEIEEKQLSKLHRATAVNMHRNWSAIPHVAQFNEADISDLESFRGELRAESDRRQVKLTLLPFLLKACVKALQEYPQFNVSLHSSGEYLVQKHYYHIGVAVATEAGLLVPVVRNVDQKSIWELAEEVAELAAKAKSRKLTPAEMQGACFSISSLGALGGTGFIPIINAPEVAILGVSKTEVKPVHVNGEFVARKMLPFTLSYDHRAVNGVDGGMFATYLAKLLSDIRHLTL